MSTQSTQTQEWHPFSWTADGHTPKVDTTSRPTEAARLIMVAQSNARRSAS